MKKNARSDIAEPTMAQNADRHVLYQKSVQDAPATRTLMETFFQARNHRKPLSLREDFCGTALLCAEWVNSDPQRTATGLDLDRPTLKWASLHNKPPVKSAARRMTLLAQNVLEPTDIADFDIICAFNFSYCVFQDRETLKRYFQNAFNTLADDGVFILDMHGGPDAQFQLEEPRDVEDFEYVWEQEFFDPINNHTVCHIHFRFPDGSELRNAFTYDWRHWSMPELRDILKEVGFKTIDCWWDGDEDEYMIHEHATNLECWVAFLAAWK